MMSVRSLGDGGRVGVGRSTGKGKSPVRTGRGARTENLYWDDKEGGEEEASGVFFFFFGAEIPTSALHVPDEPSYY